MEALDKGKVAEATLFFSMAQNQAPGYAPVHRFAAKAHECAGNWALAAVACQKLLGLGAPDAARVKAHIKLLHEAERGGLSWEPFQCVTASGNDGKAVAALANGACRDKYSLSVLRLWGMAWRARMAWQAKDYALAAKRYESLFGVKPLVSLPVCRLHWADALAKQGGFAKGSKLYQRLINTEDKPVVQAARAGLAELFMLWGQDRIKAKDWRRAEAYLAKAWAGGRKDALKPYLDALKRRGRFARARDVLSEAIAAPSSDAQAQSPEEKELHEEGVP